MRGEILVVLAVRGVLVAFITSAAPSVAFDALLPPYVPTTKYAEQRSTPITQHQHQLQRSSHRSLASCSVLFGFFCRARYLGLSDVCPGFTYVLSCVGASGGSSHKSENQPTHL